MTHIRHYVWHYLVIHDTNTFIEFRVCCKMCSVPRTISSSSIVPYQLVYSNDIVCRVVSYTVCLHVSCSRCLSLSLYIYIIHNIIVYTLYIYIYVYICVCVSIDAEGFGSFIVSVLSAWQRCCTNSNTPMWHGEPERLAFDV